MPNRLTAFEHAGQIGIREALWTGMTLAADAPTTDGRENPATDISRIVHAQDG